MTRTSIFVAALVVPLAIQSAACSQTDPMTQKSGTVQSKDCATEVKRVQDELRDAPNRRRGERVPEATVHLDEAFRQASAGNEAACWRELEAAQSIMP